MGMTMLHGGLCPGILMATVYQVVSGAPMNLAEAMVEEIPDCAIRNAIKEVANIHIFPFCLYIMAVSSNNFI